MPTLLNVANVIALAAPSTMMLFMLAKIRQGLDVVVKEPSSTKEV